MQYLRLEQNKKVYKVTIDDVMLGYLDRKTLTEAGLEPVKEEPLFEMLITDTLVNVIREALENKAWETSIKMLTVSDYAASEISFKLRFRGYAKELIESVIERLYEYGYLNDRRFAETYIRSYARKKGRRIIRMELDQKGIRLPDLDAIFDRVYEEEGLSESAVRDALLEKKFPVGDKGDPGIRRKMNAFLYRKGFSPDTVDAE